jgi:hypothetical protein
MLSVLYIWTQRLFNSRIVIFRLSSYCTRWFKYDRDWLCVNKSQFVPVIFEPPCIILDKDNYFLWCSSPTQAKAALFLRFLDHIQWHMTVGTTVMCHCVWSCLIAWSDVLIAFRAFWSVTSLALVRRRHQCSPAVWASNFMWNVSI